MVDLEHDLHLDLCSVHVAVFDKHVLANGLDCIQLFCALQLREEHLAESAATDDHL